MKIVFSDDDRNKMHISLKSFLSNFDVKTKIVANNNKLWGLKTHLGAFHKLLNAWGGGFPLRLFFEGWGGFHDFWYATTETFLMSDKNRSNKIFNQWKIIGC